MKLMAVTDDMQSVRDLASKIIGIKDKIDIVQIREKTKTAQEIITLLEYMEEGGVEKDKIILNDRLDIALLMGIPSVHLPEKGLPVKLVKQNFPHIRVGRSVHSYEGAKKAERDGADYVLYGHCFETNSKKGKTPNGIQPILEMKEELRIPVYAIGGITLNKIDTLQQVKADGIAVISGIFSAEKPFTSTKQYYEAINHESKI
ncbi:transcriptional regulator [Peribacillus loiseleuriae]|uniref:Transcriptional regulator n=2 Tax=Peribacillus loiseleuriae TaxID=1679170 RepID=A0A0K9GTT0_9BACI|nr:transcriptional regulator [Peribacillus loiseleuriae]